MQSNGLVDPNQASQKLPVISVVVPLYNKALTIRRALNSVLQQTFQDYEIIVVDDGSTDSGGQIVRQVNDSRIRLITQANQGVSVARNRGIQEARASLVAFLDADDEWKVQFLETVLTLRGRYPQAGAYATAYEVRLAGQKTVYHDFDGVPIDRWVGLLDNYFRSAILYTPFCASSVAVDMNVFTTIGYFAAGVGLGEDLDMWVRIAIRYPIAYDNSRLSIYHYDTPNRASQQGFSSNVPFTQTIRSAIESGSIPKEIQIDALEFLARHQIQAASHCLKAGDRFTALSILQSIRYTRLFRSAWLWWRFWAGLPDTAFRLALNVYHAIKFLVNRLRG
jgi:glycosyltransferase involved in cell wall biosynthesis